MRKYNDFYLLSTFILNIIASFVNLDYFFLIEQRICCLFLLGISQIKEKKYKGVEIKKKVDD
jgi:hypothetical protein